MRRLIEEERGTLAKLSDPNSAEYWKARALRAEVLNRRLQQQASDDSWRISNYREEQQRRRDAEIGDMGGGG